jgi:hypothetical protein
MITAVKNGIQRNFSKPQWDSMPKDKYGWSQVGIQTKAAIIPNEIIQKKMVGATVKNIIPDEIIIKKSKKNVDSSKQDNS